MKKERESEGGRKEGKKTERKKERKREREIGKRKDHGIYYSSKMNKKGKIGDIIPNYKL